SEAMLGLKTTLDELFVITSSGIQIVDVRDLALAHLRLLERGGGPVRYAMGGQFFRWEEFATIVEGVVGAKLRKLRIAPRLMQAAGKLGDLLHRFMPMEMPLSFEAMWYATEWTPSDDSRVQAELGFRYRDIRETLADSILWLADKGHLKRLEYAEHIRRGRAKRAHKAGAGTRSRSARASR
ncbi:MAG: hypothetical protein ACKPE6_12490, partial [Gammaproteobacteria bacterium]